MEELSTHDRLCNGSGYCGCTVYRRVTKATLKKRRNVKAEFLGEESSDEEYEVDNTKENSNKSTHFQAPTPIVNSFRGRFNSTYTATPSWYSKK